MRLKIEQWAVDQLRRESRIEDGNFACVIDDYRSLRTDVIGEGFLHLKGIKDVEFNLVSYYRPDVFDFIVTFYDFSDENGEYVYVADFEEEKYRAILAHPKTLHGIDVDTRARTLKFFHLGKWYARQERYDRMAFAELPPISFKAVERIIENKPTGSMRDIYRQLVKTHHPDVNSGSPDANTTMQFINTAYAEKRFDELRKMATTYTTRHEIEPDDLFSNYTQIMYEAMQFGMIFTIRPRDFSSELAWVNQWGKLKLSMERTFDPRNFNHTQRVVE